jgi:hypothetical protein
MVKTQAHVITYLHPFAAVTSSLWSKYDHHKYVQNIEILDRHVDEHGRLHSTRLLSMGGNLPSFIKAFVPMKHVHMLETVVVDPATQIMTVETSNITCRSVMDARSRSRYSPSPEDPNRTKYEIAIFVRAFPGADYAPSASAPAAASESAASSKQGGDTGKSEWKLEIVTGGGSAAGSDQASLLSRWQQGYIAGKMESWVVNKLLSNVSKGEQYIDGFCRRWRERHYMLCESSASPPQLASTAVGSHPSPSDRSLLEKQMLERAASEMSQGVRSAVNKQLRLSRFLSRQLSLFQRATDAQQ